MVLISDSTKCCVANFVDKRKVSSLAAAQKTKTKIVKTKTLHTLYLPRVSYPSQGIMSKASSNGQQLWNKVPKANAELFALTYGALVTEVIRDADENLASVNEKLEKIGYSIGIRCVDEFLAKSNAPYCKSLAETAEVLGKTAFRMFLGIVVEVVQHSPNCFSLTFQDNPLSLFVELPDNYKEDLEYSILYCGVIRGALEMLNYKVDCQFVKSPLKGDDIHEIKVDVKQVLADGAGDDYKEE